jgi:hypothetical protein
MEEHVFLEQLDSILGLGYEDKVTVDRYCSILDESMHGTVQGAFHLIRNLWLLNSGWIGAREGGSMCILFEAG